MYNPILPFYKQGDIYLERGEGCLLIDDDGKKYVDFESGDWASCLGHSHPEISEVLNDQASKLIHDGLKFKCKSAEQLSLELLDLLEMKEGKSVFLNSGSEAVNLAITMAQKLTKREFIVKIEGSYLSAFGYGNINNPMHINVPINNEEFINTIDFSTVAAFVFEAGSSHGLVNFAPSSMVDKLTEKARANACLLIANEVTLGFGRTGKWVGYQHYNYKPDIVALGKGLGNGYPISAVCVNKTIAELFDQNHFRYAQSHQNDPLGCEVARKVVEIIDRNKLIDKANDIGNYLAMELGKLRYKYPKVITEIKARGLVIALVLNNELQAEKINHELFNKGFIVGQSKSVLRFMPPLIISSSQIKGLIEVLYEILSKYE